MDSSDEVMSGVSDFNFRSRPNFGECNVAAIDFNGRLILNVCENFKSKQIIPDRIDICSTPGSTLKKRVR
jgi:hypothetical protein